MALHKLRALEYLTAVVEHGGFNAAARKLGVAAPSVHRLVKALEAELGMTLLDRTTSPMQPAADAVAYVERARQLVRELQGLDASLHDKASAPSGVIRVAAHSVALQYVLAPLLPLFHERFPQVQLDVRDAGVERELSRLDADVLLQVGWPTPQEAMVRTLAHSRWLVLATPSYWARNGVPHHPTELARHPCTLFRTPSGEVLRRWSFVRGTEQVEVEMDGWLVSDNRSALETPLLAGQVVARVIDHTARDGVRDGRLQPVLLDWRGLHAPPLTLLIRKAVARQPRVRAWIDFMAEQGAALDRTRLPAGLLPVQPSDPPGWFRRRVG